MTPGDTGIFGREMSQMIALPGPQYAMGQGPDPDHMASRAMDAEPFLAPCPACGQFLRIQWDARGFLCLMRQSKLPRVPMDGRSVQRHRTSAGPLRHGPEPDMDTGASHGSCPGCVSVLF